MLTAEETRPGPLYLSLSVVCTHAVCVREWGRGDHGGPEKGG